MLRLNFSPEIRLGDLLATCGVISGVLLVYTNVKVELSRLNEAQVAQVATNGEIRAQIRQVSEDVRQDIRELRGEVRKNGRSM